MKRRVLTITLSVLLALIGTAGVLAYVNHANARALAGQQAVNVLVARGLIPAGTSAAAAQADGLLAAEKLPASSVPSDALTAITPAVSNLVLDADLQAGQLLLSQMLTAASQASGLAVPKGMVGVSVLFCTPEAVAGNVHPGSKVSIYNTTIGTTGTISAVTSCSGPNTEYQGTHSSTRLILANVTVISVGVATATDSGGSSGTSNAGLSANSQLITVAVKPDDAATLIGLAENGLPYLTLSAS